MRRWSWPVAALGVVLLMSGCAGPGRVLSGPTIDPADPQLVAIRAHSHLEPCPAAETAGGGLPHMTLACLGGGRGVALDTLKGPLLINLFQGDCVACRRELPALEAFYHQYGDQVPVIGIDTTDTVPGIAMKEAIGKGVTYPLLADLDGNLQGSPLSVRRVPSTYALDAHGQVHFVSLGAMTSPEQIVSLLAAHAGIVV